MILLRLLLGICILALALAMLAFFIFAGLVLPIWMVIHCANSSASAKRKTWWILAMLLLWPLGAWVYAFRTVKQPLLRWGLVAGGLATLGLAAVALTQPKALDQDAQPVAAPGAAAPAPSQE